MTDMPHSAASPIADVDLRLAREVLKIEAAAITSLVARIDERFAEAVTTLDACAATLKGAGAREVRALTMARASFSAWRE